MARRHTDNYFDEQNMVNTLNMHNNLHNNNCGFDFRILVQHKKDYCFHIFIVKDDINLII